MTNVKLLTYCNTFLYSFFPSICITLFYNKLHEKCAPLFSFAFFLLIRFSEVRKFHVIQRLVEFLLYALAIPTPRGVILVTQRCVSQFRIFGKCQTGT